MTSYRFPGQNLQTVQIQGSGSSEVISAGLLGSAVGGSLISTTTTSSDEVVHYEVNLHFSDPSEQDYVGIYIYRDSTIIFQTFGGVADSTDSVNCNIYTGFMERPGVGTFVYSYRTNALTATSTVVKNRCWVKLKRVYLPVGLSEISSNTVTY